ncbi:MAG: folylpolyglutamate synthase/dihydrofolate synthase family protein [Coxiellaceae bacterium]|nr:folylpolyglutamate synthase/dihydrofolate synthase family protein [Coxiellaceae bacterium]
MRTKDEWFLHIQQIHRQRIELGLDRIGQVAARLNVMTFKCPVITVAGTNGKGSCVKTLETIYALAGYRVGLYTSPHLIDFNERIRIDNSMIDDDALLEAFSVVEQARGTVIVSFFEFITLAALFLFQQARCDVIILEVGLGGRLDAVNIVESDVAILTSVALDHMEFLGNDIVSIGYEKASIARENKPFICAEQDPPVSVEKTVTDKKAILYHIYRDFFYDEKKYPKPSLKKENVAAAIQAVQLLQSILPVSENTIAEGIVKTVWPGRFEIIDNTFSCVLDVAHNPHASAWLAEQYTQLPKAYTTGIVGMLKDKAQIETIQALLPIVDRWFVCDLSRLETERGSDGRVMIDFLQSQRRDCRYFESVEAAMLEAHCQRQGERALIFGSFYTIASAKKWISNDFAEGI